MELGKLPSSTEKGKDRKKPKEEEGDRFGRDKKGKGKEKKEARKDGGDGFSVDRRKAASAVFPAGAPYLIRAAWDVKGREDETGLASERGSFNTVFQRERHNFSVQQTNRATSKIQVLIFKIFFLSSSIFVIETSSLNHQHMQQKCQKSGQSVTATDFGSNGLRFESGRDRCVESLDKALYSHCPKEKPSH